MRTEFCCIFVRVAMLLVIPCSQLSTAFAQGGLTPSGAPAPTMKTLDQVEPRTPIRTLPFTISVSGSYYLTQNLTLTSSTFENGITVATNNVSIDLKGFTLTGRGNTGSGISVSATWTNLTVRDGTLQGWGYRGVDAESEFNCQLLQLRASNNGDAGVSAGKSSTVMQCTCYSNAYTGIIASSSSVVQGCAAMFNGNTGISANVGSTISDCSSSYNIGGIGITTGTIRGCTAAFNDEDGISAYHSTVVDCNVQANHYRGITAGESCTVSRCTSTGNSTYGIQVDSYSLISDNVCQQNGFLGPGAGIYVLGNQNRIEGNHIVKNNIGLQIIATNNIILRNSALSNGTNYIFTGAQIFGPTNNLTGAGGVITNQNPWANFSL
jgi:hypothetical protein